MVNCLLRRTETSKSYIEVNRNGRRRITDVESYLENAGGGD
jgi:hypothetical protein